MGYTPVFSGMLAIVVSVVIAAFRADTRMGPRADLAGVAARGLRRRHDCGGHRGSRNDRGGDRPDGAGAGLQQPLHFPLGRLAPAHPHHGHDRGHLPGNGNPNHSLLHPDRGRGWRRHDEAGRRLASRPSLRLLLRSARRRHAPRGHRRLRVGRHRRVRSDEDRLRGVQAGHRWLHRSLHLRVPSRPDPPGRLARDALDLRSRRCLHPPHLGGAHRMVSRPDVLARADPSSRCRRSAWSRRRARSWLSPPPSPSAALSGMSLGRALQEAHLQDRAGPADTKSPG